MATGRPLVISLARYATPIRQYSVSPQSFAAWRARPSGPYLGLVLPAAYLPPLVQIGAAIG